VQIGVFNPSKQAQTSAMGSLCFIRDNIRFLLAGMILTLNSSYGQTFFISIFAARIMSEFSLSDGQWGVIYTIGTTGSAIVMFWAGTLSDRFRVRKLAWLVVPGLAFTCVGMALNPWASGLVVVVFLLRLFGQGMMFQLASVSMARWFVARRGLALSMSGLGFWLGQATLPILFAALLAAYDWRSLWIVAAALILLSFPLLLWLLTQERTPQSLAKESHSVGMNNRHWTRAEVLRSPLFWMLLPMLLGPPAWGTALFFQQVHIAAVKGWNLVEYLSLIPIMTAVSVGVTLISGQLLDRLGSSFLIRIVLFPWMAGFAVLALADSLSLAMVAFVFFGIAHGTQSTTITAFWAEFFGTRHIGAIKAAATSVMVFGSAIGPGISGALIDAGFDFPTQMAGIVMYFTSSALLVWVAVIRAKPSLPSSAEIDIERA